MAKERRKPFRGDDKPTKGDMTPMIDVTFQLLIFFMLTIKFKMLEGKLAAYLPKDVGVNTTPAEPKEKVEIQLKVEREGTKMDPQPGREGPWSGEGPYKYGPDRVVLYSVGPKSTRNLDELRRRLQDLRAQDPERPATIDPLPGTVYDDVIRVLDIAIDVGYRDITFVGDRSGVAIPR